LTAEIKYGGTVTNVKRKRVPGIVGAATAKLPWASYLHSWCSGQLSLPSLLDRL